VLLYKASCGALADTYVEADAILIGLDLLLLKRQVYRHLLFNGGLRGGKRAQRPHFLLRMAVAMTILEACAF
jgi:hypothetical protein